MMFYEVTGGIARFGPGAELMIDFDQHRRRAHRLEIVTVHESAVSVVAGRAIEFKIGEVIGLEAEPPWSMRDLMTAIDDEEEARKRMAAQSAAVKGRSALLVAAPGNPSADSAAAEASADQRRVQAKNAADRAGRAGRRRGAGKNKNAEQADAEMKARAEQAEAAEPLDL